MEIGNSCLKLNYVCSNRYVTLWHYQTKKNALDFAHPLNGEKKTKM